MMHSADFVEALARELTRRTGNVIRVERTVAAGNTRFRSGVAVHAIDSQFDAFDRDRRIGTTFRFIARTSNFRPGLHATDRAVDKLHYAKKKK